MDTKIENSELKQIDFNNTEIAFAYKSDAELKKSHLLFNSIKYNFLAKIGPPLIELALSLNIPIKGLLKSYFFDQFCGGTNLQDTEAAIKRLHKFGVYTTLDYAVEAQKNENGFTKTKDELLNAIQFASAYKEITFMALKVTGLGSFELLEKASSSELNAYEKIQLSNLYEKLDQICKKANELGQSVLIDAEESWIQTAIDKLAEDLMIKYNKDYPAVYTTAQLYRHDRLDYIKYLYDKMIDNKVFPAIKIVRGAYLEKENDRAKRLGYRTPMNPTKQATDDLFNKSLHFILDRYEKFALYAGTHNEESSMNVVQYIIEKNINFKHPNIYLAQLYGMSDHISFNLGKYGFNVGKYLPYGPINLVLPYLFRRAEENTSIAGQMGRELILIQKEIERRKKRGRQIN